MQKNSRTENAKRNIVFGLFNKFFSIVFPFITRSFLIKTIGAEYLGVDSLFTSILQILNLSELGMSSAIVFSMYEPMAKGDTNTICSLLNFFRRVYKYIGLFILSVGLCFIPFLDYFIKGDVPADINVLVVYLIFLFNTVIGYMLFGYKNSILNASQRVDVISNCASITKGLLALVQGIMLYTTYNYYCYLVVLPLTTIVNNFLIYYYVKKNYPEYTCRGDISKETLHSFKKRVAGLFATKFCSGMRTSIDSLCVSAFIGLTVTAIYSNYYMVVVALTNICSVFAASILAGVGNRIVTNTPDSNYRQMRVFDFVYMWFSGIACVCMVAFFQTFMRMWVGNDLMFPDYMPFLFGLYFYSLRTGDMKGVYQDASGLWWENRYRAFFEVGLNIVLSIILVQLIGPAGVVLSAVTSLLLVNFGMGSHIVFKYYFKNGKLKEFYVDHIKYLLTTSITVMMTYYLCSTISNTIVGFMAKLAICLFVSNLAYLCFYWHCEVRKEAWLMVTGLIRKK